MNNTQFSISINIMFAVALVFFANTSFAKGLKSDELKALINDKTVESESASGFTAKTYYLPDGSYRKNKRNEFTKGVWYINSDGKLCKKVDGESTASCRLIVKKGDVWKVYKVPGNPAKSWKHKSTWLRILDGNPDKL